MSGATGLDYAALAATLKLMRLPAAEWPDLFEDIRVMENAALETMHAKRN